MSHELIEAGLFVAFDKDPIANLKEAGLMVIHDSSVPTSNAKLKQVGLMMIYLAPDQGRSDIQGAKVTLQEFIQGHSFKRRLGQV